MLSVNYFYDDNEILIPHYTSTFKFTLLANLTMLLLRDDCLSRCIHFCLKETIAAHHSHVNVALGLEDASELTVYIRMNNSARQPYRVHRP